MATSAVVLPGVDRYRVNEAMFEGLRVILSFRGEAYSPAYIQGVSGGAFVMAGPCPCAPTCGHDTDPATLARLLGYEIEELPLWGEGVDARARLPEVIARVKEDIDEGRPALVWNAFTVAEWDVVCGYDEADGTFLGRGSYAGLTDHARAPQERTLTGCVGYPALGAIFIGERKGEFRSHEVDRDTLARAVQHAHTTEDRIAGEDWRAGVAGEWRFRRGLGCYEWWIGSLLAQPARRPNVGDRYCLATYQSTHGAAGDYCRELAAKHVGASADLLAAADLFSAEADSLGRCFRLLFPGRAMPVEIDAARNREAAELLTAAMGSYDQAIQAVQRALTGL